MYEKLFEHPELMTLFLILTVPGLVMLKVWDQIVPSGARRDFSKSVFEAISYSAINMGLFLPLVTLMRASKLGPVLYPIALFVMLLGAPAAWPFLFRKLLATQWMTKYGLHPYEQAWDYVFGLREPFWVVVHLRDLRRIGGRFGGKSFASSSPAEPQLYIEEVWKLDANGHLGEPVERSRGIIILAKDILAVEFFSYYE
jgi:Family of unknown function (DUF6338)